MIGAFEFTHTGRRLRAIFVPGGIHIERLDGDLRPPVDRATLIAPLMERVLCLLRLGWRRPVMPTDTPEVVILDIGSLDTPLPTADDTAEQLAAGYAASDADHVLMAHGALTGDQATHVWREAIARAFLDGRAGAISPVVIRPAPDDPGTTIRAPWFDARGRGPSEMALHVRPFAGITGAPGAEIPPALGLRIRVDHTGAPPMVYPGATHLVNSGFMLDRAQVLKLERALATWLEDTAPPANCADSLAFVDGELDAKRAEEFRTHLKNCEACQIKVVDEVQLSARLREGPPQVQTADPPNPSKRYFMLDNDGCYYFVVATDLDHARRVLADSGCEFGDPSEGGAGPLAELEARSDVAWREIDATEAATKTCHTGTTDHDRGSIPLTQCDLGEWFCTEY